MSMFDAGQDIGRTMLAVEVLTRVQQRLESIGDAAALCSLHHFHRMSPSELELLVALEVGVFDAAVSHADAGAGGCPQAGAEMVAA